jgi:hypothetical protein
MNELFGKLLRLLGRVVIIMLIGAAIGALLNRTSKSLESGSHPAGFARGLVQGALMPLAMPNLALGKDVVIYSQNNTGVSYKLGYTLGVDICGALFFGAAFWRISRYRRPDRN